MKNLYIFISHFVNEEVKSAYLKIADNVDINTDVYWAISDICYEEVDLLEEEGINIIRFNNELVQSGKAHLNPFKPFEEKFKSNNEINIDDYEYIYFNEYDVYYTGKINDLIEEFNSSNTDLLCAYVKKFEFGNNTPWMWTNMYADKYPDNPENFEYLLKSCLSFVRISTEAFKFISKNESPVKDEIYELYYPTLLYNNGFTIGSFSSNIVEDQEEFYEFNVTDPSIYYVGKVYEHVEDMVNYRNEHFDRDMLFTTYKIPHEENNSKKYIQYVSKDKTDNVSVSVLMPAYNAQNFLNEAIDSILNQENFDDFELVIVNDGSTDSTEDIIQEYLKTNNKIRYIKKKHSGLVDTLNIGYKYCKGKYVVRMDSDDISYPDRLLHQFVWMENHPEADLCSGSMEWGNGKEVPEYCILGDRELTLESLLQANQIAHPCVIMRKSSMDKMPYLYENFFDHAEDYKLWCSCLKHGLRLFTDSKVVLWYRQIDNEGQITQSSSESLWNTTAKIQQAFAPVDLNNMNQKFTAILTFKNELDEVERTVINIRATSKNLPIILINDGSTDPTDYEWVAREYNCEYYYNETSLGVAGSRDYAVSKVKTPYFVLLDAHMRFYNDDWVENIVEDLELYPNSIITSQSETMWKTSEDIYENETPIDINKKGSNYGAYSNMDEAGFEFTAKWTHKPVTERYRESQIVPISCVLGAFYASSVKWWNYIRGLEGLNTYGQDEPLMSIKTWLLGGQVLLSKDFFVGHLYRDKHPYPVPADKVYSNSVYLNHLFARSEEEAQRYDEGLRKRLGDQCFNESYDLFMKDIDKFNDMKAYLEEHKVKDMDWYLEFNNRCYYKE